MNCVPLGKVWKNKMDLNTAKGISFLWRSVCWHGKQNGEVPVTRFTFLGSLKKLGKSYLLGGFIYTPTGLLGFPGSSAIKESACNAKDPGSIPGELFPWRRDRLPTPVFLGFPGGSDGKESPAMWKTWVWSLGWEDPLDKGMATHSTVLTWRIPMDRGAWLASVHGVATSRTWLSIAQHWSLKLLPFPQSKLFYSQNVRNGRIDTLWRNINKIGQWEGQRKI